MWRCRYRLTSINLITVRVGGNTVIAQGTYVFDITAKIAFLNDDQIRHLSDPKFSDILFDKIPTLNNFIRDQSGTQLELPFTLEAKRPLYLPLNRSVAAGVILALFNGNRDPLEKIQSLYGSDSGDSADEITRVTTTYYMCCLKYVTDVDFTEVVDEGRDEHVMFMLDDQSCIPTVLQGKYEKLKDNKTPIPQGALAFHAVYGAYVLCRPVANKAEFRQRVLKRYNAFLASIQQTAETTAQLELQAGGTRVNNLAVSRPTLRKAVFRVIKSEYGDIRTSAVKNHIKMLTALSEMTTYALVNRVLATGGNVIFLKPLPEQVVKFMNEKMEVERMLERNNYNKDEIIYIHLFMPHIQCFRSVDYADLVQTAFAIEEHLDPKNKTLERYRSKTEGITVNIRQIKTFLSAQTTTMSCTIDEKTKTELRLHFGKAVESMIADAEKVMKIIVRQSRMD